MNTRALLPVAVLASGRGSNLQALIRARDAGLPIDLRLVASDRTEAPALRHAEAAGIATLALDPAGYATRRDYDLDLFRRVAESGAQLLVLAGFMRILDADAVNPWRGRMVNVHPSLLPKYRGLHTHRRALEAGDTEHGASVHFVSPELDGGPVIAQARIDVRPGDTEADLAERLLPFEHRLLPAAVALIADGRLKLTAQGIAFDGTPLRQPLQLDGETLRIA
ncbi:phosphoribosylglycinamide formyltransferase [Oleiagrimonas soli]|uniref:Phosphoribosylglycinamide formyltransferase n=1 Tax=Oleiagrimonas soli TaxID=1543381 RepID=A0A099CU60_9GAMM|nr:phosphoribosylglycinamide formyltransferase [Oleiagrimonas soli]KGI77226.1 phosphoribosylglycinamide formyltransferase [Oleiagrimonas soli]MBB6185590.1 phosphoribosylglycinamide formyltransferase-1 [Oleiagrimonas soli]